MNEIKLEENIKFEEEIAVKNDKAIAIEDKNQNTKLTELLERNKEIAKNKIKEDKITERGEER